LHQGEGHLQGEALHFLKKLCELIVSLTTLANQGFVEGCWFFLCVVISAGPVQGKIPSQFSEENRDHFLPLNP